MRKITLSADQELIERARERAKRENKTLSAAFREWLEQYADRRGPIMTPKEFDELMRSLSHIKFDRPFTRDEMDGRPTIR
jgi:hypothetical protein